VVTRDSAGVEIVENATSAWSTESAWTVGAAPQITIGGADGSDEYLLTSIAGAFKTRHGHFVVADRASMNVRIYDSSGSFLRSFGRTGSGPGEFQSIANAFPYRGDSIAVWDGVAHRLLVFDSTGTFSRAISVVTAVGPPQGSGEGLSFGSTGHVAGAFTDGSLIVIPDMHIVDQPGALVHRTTAPFHISPDGEYLADAGRFPAGATYVFNFGALGKGQPPQLPVPYGRSFSAMVDGDRLYVAAAESFEISVWTPGPGIERLIRKQTTPATVGEAEREAYRMEQRRRLRDGEFGRDAPITPEGLEQALREIEFPATLPPFDAILVDSEGYLWVRSYRMPGDTDADRWSVFDQNGALLGEVETPSQLQVRQIGGDFVLGIVHDDFGVPSVRAHALRRRDP
jgi:hypothetical protein